SAWPSCRDRAEQRQIGPAALVMPGGQRRTLRAHSVTSVTECATGRKEIISFGDCYEIPSWGFLISSSARVGDNPKKVSRTTHTIDRTSVGEETLTSFTSTSCLLSSSEGRNSTIRLISPFSSSLLIALSSNSFNLASSSGVATDTFHLRLAS